MSWFQNLFDARRKIAAWKIEYNLVSYYPTSLCSWEQGLVLFGIKYCGSTCSSRYSLLECLS